LYFLPTSLTKEDPKSQNVPRVPVFCSDSFFNAFTSNFGKPPRLIDSLKLFFLKQKTKHIPKGVQMENVKKKNLFLHDLFMDG